MFSKLALAFAATVFAGQALSYDIPPCWTACFKQYNITSEGCLCTDSISSVVTSCITTGCAAANMTSAGTAYSKWLDEYCNGNGSSTTPVGPNTWTATTYTTSVPVSPVTTTTPCTTSTTPVSPVSPPPYSSSSVPSPPPYSASTGVVPPPYNGTATSATWSSSAAPPPPYSTYVTSAYGTPTAPASTSGPVAYTGGAPMATALPIGAMLGAVAAGLIL